ncbi:MAG: RDD family protein [Actinobacteria bacterium]|nr:RDD family protein [Actinomycetota bacterium]
MELDDRVTVSGAEGIDLDLVLAGVGSRGAAVIVDLLLQALALLVVAAAAGAAGRLSSAVVAVAAFVVVFAYPTVAEAFAGGRTVGKALLGIAVVADDGTPVTFLSAAIRNVLRFVDSLPGVYLVGIVAVVATSRNQRVGDLAAGTLVVHRPRRAPASDLGGRGFGPATGGPSPAEMAGWDVSAVTADEVAALRSFLGRRGSLDPMRRAELAQALAFQILPKVAGVPLEGGPEVFLERVVAAKTSR